MNNLRRRLPPLASLAPFEAAARHESFTCAAAELGVTQAAVSRQILALEADLGVRMFERRNRAARLTADGRELARVVSAALESVAAKAGEMRGAGAESEVVLFAQLCEGLYWLMPRLSGFHQRWPGVEVRVTASTRPLSETAERFDLALQTTARASGGHPLAFTAADEVFPVCSPALLDRRAPPLSLDALAGLRLLHHRAEPQDWPEWDDWLAMIGSPLRVGLDGAVFDSYPMLIQAALEGYGVALGWRRSAQAHLESGALVRPCAESAPLPDGLSVYRRAGAPLRPQARRLLEWLGGELTGF